MDFTDLDLGPAMSQSALREDIAKLKDKIKGAPPSGYSWATTYSAGSDVFVYRRFLGTLPAHAAPYASKYPPLRVVAFCEDNNCDVALYDELRGVVRKPKLGTDEAP